MVTLTKHIMPGPDLHCAGSLAFRGFLQHLSTKYKWRPKKSNYLSAGPWHCAMWQIRRWLLHYVHKKFRWGSEVATFRTKSLDFRLVVRLNWLEKIELRGCADLPGRQYYFLLITVVRKDAKRNWKWRNKIFLLNFCHRWYFNWGGPSPLGHPLVTPMILR